MTVGDKIPEILGIDQDGREIKASDYRGQKIVLYSYPKANTSGCTAEACSLQAHKEEMHKDCSSPSSPTPKRLCFRSWVAGVRRLPVAARQ